jgi:hypothetical protein
LFGRRIHWPTVAATALAVVLVQLPELAEADWSISLDALLPLFVGWVAGRPAERRLPISRPAALTENDADPTA